MLRKLSPSEREALVKLGNKGPAANFDQSAMAKLFTLELVELDSQRRLSLTILGRQYYDAIRAEDANTGRLFPAQVQPLHN